MGNEEFINTLRACGKLTRPSEEYIKDIIDCEIELAKYYKRLIKLLSTEDEIVSNEQVLISTFIDVIKYYKRDDKTQLESFEEFIDLVPF